MTPMADTNRPKNAMKNAKSQEDLHYIRQKADRIYNPINRQTAERGCAPLDEQVPAVIK